MHVDQVVIWSAVFTLVVGGLGFYEKWRLDRMEKQLKAELQSRIAGLDRRS